MDEIKDFLLREGYDQGEVGDILEQLESADQDIIDAFLELAKNGQLSHVEFSLSPQFLLDLGFSPTATLLTLAHFRDHPNDMLEFLERGVDDIIDSEVDLEDESIKLFNPFHDSRGRFTTGSGIASTATSVGAGLAKAGAVGRLTGLAAKVAVQGRIKSAQRKESGEFKGKLPSEKEEIIRKSRVLGLKFKGKEYNITVDDVDRGADKLMKISSKATTAGLALYAAGALGSVFLSSNDRGRAKARAEKEWKARQQRKPDPSRDWPKTKQQDFQKMYRDLAKRYHPDVNIGGPDTTKVMQGINDFYKNRDYEALSKLHSTSFKTKLEYTLEAIDFKDPPDDLLIDLGIYHILFKDFVEGNNDYMIFDASGVEEMPPFVIENGEMIIDKPTGQLIFDMLDLVIKKADETN